MWIPFYYPVRCHHMQDLNILIFAPKMQHNAKPLDLCAHSAGVKQKWNLPAGCRTLFCMANIISPSKQVRSFTWVERRQEFFCQRSTNLAYMFSIHTSPWHCQMFCLALYAGRARKKKSQKIRRQLTDRSSSEGLTADQPVDPGGFTPQAWIVQSMLI